MNRALFNSSKPNVICECCNIQKFCLLPYGVFICSYDPRSR